MPFNGAGSNLSGASDVFFSAPANNDLLKYNSSTSKWNNASLDASIDNTPLMLRYTAGAWPTRASITSSATRTVFYMSSVTAPAPTDFVNNVDMWIRRG